ncbi:MAG: sigma-70 family RNA polymerase sigma factor [Candidatus Latescibacterota bacterium]
MEELVALVSRARAGDLGSYSALVRRFQDMAVGYAHALLGDFHLAEDAAQEAFLQAYSSLPDLREPVAFPSWLSEPLRASPTSLFRRIVFKHCDRHLRCRQVPVVALEAVSDPASGDADPAARLETEETDGRVDAAVQSLPEPQRLVVHLFYRGELSHAEIARFLGVPVQTVKSRLHAARTRLREELIDMTRENLQRQRPSRDPRFVTHIMDELACISDRGIQRLLRQVDQKDCVLALRGATPEVRDKVLGNMSQRVRTYMEEEMETLGEVDEQEVRRAQQAIVDLLREIRYQPRQVPADYPDMKAGLKEQLRTRPFSQMRFEEITQVFTDLSRISSVEGILALEEFAADVAHDPDALVFVNGLRRVVSGTGPHLLTDILEKRTRLLLQEHETRCRMIVEGIVELDNRLAPDYMITKLRAHYSLDGE